MRLLAAATEQTGDLILITRADGGFEHAERCVRARARILAPRARRTRVRRPVERGFGALSAPHQRRRSAIAASGAARSSGAGAMARPSRHRARSSALSDSGRPITHFVGVERDIDRRAQAARSARAQRAALGDRRARGRRRARDQQSAPDDHRLGRIDAGGPPDPASSRDLEAGPPGSGARGADRPQPAVIRPAQRARSRGRRSQRHRPCRRSSCASYHLQQRNITLVDRAACRAGAGRSSTAKRFSRSS